MGKATKGQSKKADRIQRELAAKGWIWFGWDGDFWHVEQGIVVIKKRTLAKLVEATMPKPRPAFPHSDLAPKPVTVKTPGLTPSGRRIIARRDNVKTVSDYAAELGVTGVPDEVMNVPVRINSRLKTSAGICRRFGYGDNARYEIEINPKCAASAHFRDTFIHEVAHAVVFDDGHGARFKAVCRSMGGTGKTYYSQEQARDMGIKRKRQTRMVVGTCDKCGYEMTRARAPRSGSVYRHKGCSGRIVID